MAEGLGPQFPFATGEAHDREVARAAAEVGHQDRRLPPEPSGVEEGRAHRLVDVAGAPRPEPLERRPVALHGQRLVGLVTGEAHRAPDHDALGGKVERSAGMAHERAQERREQVLEAEALAEDPGLLEGGAGREGLERLDEAMGVQPFQEPIDRERAALDPGAPARAVALVPEEKRGDVDRRARAAVVEGDGLGAPVRAGDRHHGVAGSEVDADRHRRGVAGALHRTPVRFGRSGASSRSAARWRGADAHRAQDAPRRLTCWLPARWSLQVPSRREGDHG